MFKLRSKTRERMFYYNVHGVIAEVCGGGVKLMY